MAKIALVSFLLVYLAIYASAGLGKRAKRGFYNSGFGNSGRSGYSDDSDEQDASVSREDNNRDCNEDHENSGSREIANNRDGRQTEKHRGGRSFTKLTSTASASSFNEGHNAPI